MSSTDLRAQEAIRTLEQNRAELCAALAASRSVPGREFPRSATFRWLRKHLAPSALASTAVTALVFKRSVLRQLVGGVLRRLT
jgi:hypothetical protein